MCRIGERPTAISFDNIHRRFSIEQVPSNNVKERLSKRKYLSTTHLRQTANNGDSDDDQREQRPTTSEESKEIGMFFDGGDRTKYDILKAKLRLANEKQGRSITLDRFRFDDVVKWNTCQERFLINNPRRFVEQVMPRYYKEIDTYSYIPMQYPDNDSEYSNSSYFSCSSNGLIAATQVRSDLRNQYAETKVDDIRKEDQVVFSSTPRITNRQTNLEVMKDSQYCNSTATTRAGLSKSHSQTLRSSPSISEFLRNSCVISR